MGADDPRKVPGGVPKRRLRAVFACDVANFSGQVSVNETRGLVGLSSVLRIGRDELERHEGDLISTPGDGLFALFESAVNAVNCALAIQERLAHEQAGSMQLRIGIHLGEVLFDGDVPFGETLNIAARLEGLADAGGILVSGAVADATAARVSATFESRGIPRLKNIPRRIGTFSVRAASMPPGLAVDVSGGDSLDQTMRFSRHAQPAAVSIDELNVALPKRGAEKPSDTTVPQAVSAPESPRPVASPPQPRGPAVAAPAKMPDGAPDAPSPAPSPAAARAPADAPLFDEDQLAEITQALAVNLGPVARIIVARNLSTAKSRQGLLAALEASLPYEDEVTAFRRRVGHLYRG